MTSAAEQGVGGFQEAVLSVADLAGAVATYVQVGGWEEVHRGTVAPELLQLWNLPRDQRTEEVLLRNPGTEHGYLRLVRFPAPQGGGRQPIMRPGSQPWDTGGHFDINLRVLDLDRTYEELEALGWSAYGQPVDFSFGPFEVRELLARGPDGVVLALIQRVQPPLEGWPHLRKVSRVFNATQIVSDFDRALRFYCDQLGFQIYLEHEGASKKPGPNVLGLPHNLTAEIPRRVAILSPAGGNDGSVEILAFQGATGADLSARARPPHRGVLSLRFPVRGLDNYLQQLIGRGLQPSDPVESELAPYGRVRLSVLSSPEGALLEFFEPQP